MPKQPGNPTAALASFVIYGVPKQANQGVAMTALQRDKNRLTRSWLSPAVYAVISTLIFASGCTPATRESGSEGGTITISVIGTNDVHGQLLPVNGNSGLPLFAGYVNNLRDIRDADGGAVLLVDAGDMWQGTLESNLTEGSFVVESFNALGYSAAAIGNHEFDFGPAGEMAIPESAADDAQGALKQRATEASFPLLAANLIDVNTGEPVDWPNVRPATLIEVAGVKVGIVGVMTEGALSVTIAANTRNLRMAPLIPTISAEARTLREKGAELVVVAAHAGSRCQSFEDPLDLSSCNAEGEIMRVARGLPAGLVDQIVAGHVHRGIAHEVNGIAIISSFSNTRAFGRVDYLFDLSSRTVTQRQIHPPQAICSFVNTSTGRCLAAGDEGAAPARYAGMAVTADDSLIAIADKAAAYTDEVKSQELGVFLETPITRAGGTKSALGHLFMDAVFESINGDVVIHNVMGGLRADLPAGELIYGSAYQVYPFDNRIVYLSLSGADLRRVIASETHKEGRRAGFSGMRVFAQCEDGSLDIDMLRPDGSEIHDDEKLTVITTDFLAMGGDSIFAPVIPEEGFSLQTDTPFMRDLFVAWMRGQGGRMNAGQFLDGENPRWNVAETVSTQCDL